MMRVLAGAAAVAAALVTFARAPAPRVLAEREEPYLEDAALARLVARIRAVVVQDGPAAHLRVELHAIGTFVDALPGIAGVPGHNQRTAEELHELLAAGELQFALRENGRSRPGTVAGVVRGRLPARRVDEHGNLVEMAAAGPELPLAVVLRSVELPPGRSLHYVIARELPRLLVTVDHDGDIAVIAAIESLGEWLAPTERRG